MKHRAPPDFQLQCGCFLTLEKTLKAQGMKAPGVVAYSDRKGNSGIAMMILKHLINPDGSKQQGMIYFNFCPICGKQIAVKLIRKVDDETEPKTKPDA